MTKQGVKVAYIFLFSISIFSYATTDLQWEKNDTPVGNITLGINESITLQLRDTEPVLSNYDLSILDNSPVVSITSVTPLFGNLSYSSAESGYWLLHYEWDTGQPVPISDWFVHWDVTIQGVTPGSYSYDCGGTGDYATLYVNVVPLPSSLVLFSTGLLSLRCKRKRQQVLR